MDYLRGPLYLDIASKGLCLVGILVMIFGQGGWFTVGVYAVALGVLFGAWSLVAARRIGPRSGSSGTTLLRARPPENDDVREDDGNP
jgi:type IV secretory pathway VirB2 component (pilin)